MLVVNSRFLQASTAENLPTEYYGLLVGLGCWLAEWRIRDATAEVVSWSATRLLPFLRRYIRRAPGTAASTRL